MVTRLNYAELTGEDSVWDNLKTWLGDEERLGADLVCDINESRLRITSPFGARIWFKAFDREAKKQKVKSESHDRILNDEASELHPKVIQFQYRSLRSPLDSFIPLSMCNFSNPGGEATDYLCDNYIDGAWPYYWIDWRHNPFINRRVYSKTLDMLDYVDQRYQKYGDWKYRPAKGDLFPETLLNGSRISGRPGDTRIVHNLRGVDMAITTTGDYSAFVKWLVDNRGHYYIADVVWEQTEYPEDLLCSVIEKDNPQWKNGRYETDYYLEKGIAEAGELAKRFLLDVLEPYIETGLSVNFLPPIVNKFTRARPMARAWKNGQVSIIDRPNIFGDKWVDAFIGEYKDFGPNEKEYDHDDMVDAGSIGFNQVESGDDPYTESHKRYVGKKSPVKRRKKFYGRQS